MEKRTVFILIQKTLLIKKVVVSGQTLQDMKKMLRTKIVHLKEIYNFDFDHVLIKRTVFVLIVKNFIKNKKFDFPVKLCDIRKNF